MKLEEKGNRVKVLGGGCEKCEALLANTRAALAALGSDLEVEYVTDMDRIRKLGLYMKTPVLMVDGGAVSKQKVLTPEEAQAILKPLL